MFNRCNNMKTRVFLITLLALVWSATYAQTLKKITMEDLFKSRSFVQRQLPGLQSMKDGNHYTLMEEGTKIVKYSFQSGQKVATLFDLKEVTDAPCSDS